MTHLEFYCSDDKATFLLKAERLFDEGVELAPMVRGRWIVTKEYNDVIGMDVVKYTCSACEDYRLSATGLSKATNYCPNCGAKMDAEVSDNG